MAVSGKLGVKQIPVNRKLEAPAVRWHQADRFDLGFEFLKQFGCQTDSTVSIVSGCAINQIDFQHFVPPII
jgi:hypothetical protein